LKAYKLFTKRKDGTIGPLFINIKHHDKSFIYIEKMKSGKYKLFVTKDLTDDLDKIESLEIIKGDE